MMVGPSVSSHPANYLHYIFVMFACPRWHAMCRRIVLQCHIGMLHCTIHLPHRTTTRQLAS
jgi:hypothetical protein